MKPGIQSSKMQEAKATSKYPLFSLSAKSLVVTGMLVCAIASGAYLTGNSSLFVTPQADNISQQQRDERQDAFNALTPLPMTMVEEKDVPNAVENMNLPPAAKQALLADLAKASSAQPANVPVPAQEANPVRLAWITLWDTDAEDGDTVEIESRGYSRTIVLKKVPTTFAVPVPASGVINIKGISDGDGGGITVGIASGTAKAVFPIMSEGQVLGLRVKVN